MSPTRLSDRLEDDFGDFRSLCCGFVMALVWRPSSGDLLRPTVCQCEGGLGLRGAAPGVLRCCLIRCFLTCSPMWARVRVVHDRGDVTVLQRIEGCSAREAVDRFAFDDIVVLV